MRIYSSFHDFYDGVVATDPDPDPVYVRKMVRHDYDTWPFPALRNEWGSGPGSLSAYRVIGFAGKVYPMLSVYKGDGIGHIRCFNLDEVDTALDGHKGYCEPRFRSYSKPERPLYVDFFRRFETRASMFADIFLEHECPIFLVTRGSWLLDYERYFPGFPKHEAGGMDNVAGGLYANPCLKAWGFARVLDPYTAYQELRMYLDGLAAPQRPIPPVSDADMVEIKGFDPKYGFRTPPRRRGV